MHLQAAAGGFGVLSPERPRDGPVHQRPRTAVLLGQLPQRLRGRQGRLLLPPVRRLRHGVPGATPSPPSFNSVHCIDRRESPVADLPLWPDAWWTSCNLTPQRRMGITRGCARCMMLTVAMQTSCMTPSQDEGRHSGRPEPHLFKTAKSLSGWPDCHVC